MPNSITRYSHSPKRVANAISHSSPLRVRRLLKAVMTSNLEKILARIN